MIFAEAIGREHMLVVDTTKLEGGARLHGPRGIVTSWRHMQGRDFDEAVIRWAILEEPPRLAVQLGVGTSDFDGDFEDPNNVKLAGGSSYVEIVDVPSGERTARVKHFVDGAFTWTPDGNTLWIQTAGPMLRGLDANGVDVASIDAPELSEAHERLWFDSAGRRAFMHGPFMNPFVGVVDVVAKRVTSQRPVSTRFACANREATRAFVIHNADRGLYRWDYDGGALVSGSPLALRAYSATPPAPATSSTQPPSTPPPSPPPDRVRLVAAPEPLALRFVRAWCNEKGDVAVALDDAGRLWRTNAGVTGLEAIGTRQLPIAAFEGVDGAALDLVVDVDAGVALEAATVAPQARTSGREPYVRVHDLARGSSLDVPGTSSAALARGRAYVLRDGAAFVVVDGAARPLEGWTNLAHLAGRKSGVSGGVLSVDADGRVHAIDDAAGDAGREAIGDAGDRQART